jgi:glycosyltransferase 2 family protein
MPVSGRACCACASVWVDRSTQMRSRAAALRAIVLAAALAAAVFVGLGLYADFGQLGEELRDFRWELFPLALALTAVNYLLRFWRWHIYLERVDIAVPARRSFTIFLAGLTMTITPAKLGELVKSGLLKRAFAVPVRRSAPVVLAERVTDATGVVVLAVAGGAATQSWPPLAIALVGVAGAVLLVRSPLLERFTALGEAPAAARALLATPLLVGMTLLSAVSWLFECLAAYVCVRGLDLDLSFPDTIVVFTLGTLAGALSFLPGGLGVAETSMTGLMRALGDVSKAAAAAATVLIRLATLWFAVALGLVGVALETRLSRNRTGRTGKARTSSRRRRQAAP